MSENNSSKIGTIISIILLVLILGGVFYFLNNKPNPTILKKCGESGPKIPSTPVDLEKLKSITIEDTLVGSGSEVKSGDVVCIDYKGMLLDGTVFDTSEGKVPFVTQIGVGRVIPGWDLGIVGLKEGGKRKLTIPSELAYKDRATGKIPANSTLVFEVELVKIIK